MLQRIKDYFIIKELKKPAFAGKYVQVFSHPRSGTHFLEAFLARNFYPEEDLSIPEVVWGHWSNRLSTNAANPYGKLFGSHAFPLRGYKSIDYPAIYIVRDCRAVVYSIWKTKNFLHKDFSSLTFSKFLRTKIDWVGSPAFKCKPKFNIAQHWDNHVSGWDYLAKRNSNLLILRYEDLFNHPYSVYEQIHCKFFSGQKKLTPKTIDSIKKPVGLLPNKASIESWQSVYSKEDEEFVRSCIRSTKYLAD